ncbi:MAG: Crp/Fnr family transcriptional regulator [Chloroflexi bacterium]|nr:Crp/Fnr family transcriptional regulator [Chloroflexota bacterium]
MFTLLTDPSRSNRLLAALPPEDYQRLLPALEPVAFQPTDVLYEPNRPIEYVYFPLYGVASILVVMNDGLTGEVATVGNEGMVGITLFLGIAETTTKAIYQIAGEALRLPAGVFMAEINRNSALVAILQRYTQAWMTMLTQHAACNNLHPLNERCDHWLLLTHDRVSGDQFSLTQKFLGFMLGVRRAAVNSVMQTLQKVGYIRYSRGIITIVDRPGLESVACECYGVVSGEYRRMLD